MVLGGFRSFHVLVTTVIAPLILISQIDVPAKRTKVTYRASLGKPIVYIE